MVNLIPASLYFAQSVSSTTPDRDKNCQSRKDLSLTKGTQPCCVCQQHLLVSVNDSWCDFLLSATFSYFTFMCLHFHPRRVCIVEKKGGKNHTRQELISPAATSPSRWSIFFSSKMKGQKKRSDLILYVVPGRTELMRLFSASGALLCLCEFLSFYFT